MAKLIIEAGRSSKHYWKDLWRYRELFYFLAWRDILVRYRQTAIGVCWAVLQPLLTMIILTVIFGRVAKMPSDGIPYPILVFAGMLPWQFFANSLAGSSNSLVANSNLISKIYFPRLIIPGSSVMVSLVDFSISFLLMGVLVLWYHFSPTWHFMPSWHIIFLPVLVPLAFMAALGPGLICTVLNVKYRDFRFIIPFVVQFGLYVSPVGFTSSRIPEKWHLLYSLNPLAGIIDAFRWAICGKEAFYWPGFILSLIIVSGLLTGGVIFFRRMERKFADVI